MPLTFSLPPVYTAMLPFNFLKLLNVVKAWSSYWVGDQHPQIKVSYSSLEYTLYRILTCIDTPTWMTLQLPRCLVYQRKFES
jgi:hypothetical protein